MSEIILYHNPKCSKSRQTLALLEERGIQPRIIEYLNTPLTQQQLDHILNCLQYEPLQLMRTKETRYQELGLDHTTLSREEAIQTIIDNPILMERPIVVHENKAAIGRPPENVLEILS